MRTMLILPLVLAGLSGCAVYTPYGHRGGHGYGIPPAVVIRPAPVVIAPAPIVVRPGYHDSRRRDRDYNRRPNRRDRDRDDDGVPNRSDRWPDNQRRW